MQARRAISKQMRKSLADLEDLFTGLCLKLEQRMVKEGVYCHQAGFTATYENGYTWKDNFQTGIPIQDGMDLMNAIKSRMEKTKQKIINNSLTSMGISVGSFTDAEMLQVQLFENNILKHNLRQQVYDIKNKYGSDKIMRAIELRDEKVLKDAIGFGSVKDMHSKEVFK